MKQNRFSSMVQAMALVLYLSFVSAAQAQFDAVVNAALPGYHQAPNCPDFISKAPTDWICKIAGTGNTSIPGWGWSQTDGVDLINQAVSQHFSAIIYYSDARNDQDTIYSAALNGCALSCFHTSDNNHTFYDYNYQSPNGRVFGPMASMIVSGGFSSGSGAVTAYGPQGEFMDARLDGSLDGNGNPQYAAEQSYAHATTAAKYAQIKSYHPDWNVFDVRQALRQTCTFYAAGWRNDGGYGFPRVATRNHVGQVSNFQEALINGKTLQNITLSDVDAGPPLSPGYSTLPNGSQVQFTWKPFRQSRYTSTILKIKDIKGNLLQTFEDANATSYTWTPTVSGEATAEFFTKITDPGGSTRLSRDTSLETYAKIKLTGLRTSVNNNIGLSSAEPTSSQFSFTVSGQDGSSWDVYESTDLANWQLIGGVDLTTASGPVTFTRTGLAGINYAFYRVSNDSTCSQPIGFIRRIIAAGQSALIANQLVAPDNTLAGLFAPSMPDGTVLPNGTQIQKYNGSSWDTYTWNKSTTTWLPNGNATLNPGEGVYITAPAGSAVTLTFAGLVSEGHLVNSIPEGTSVRSSIVPQTGFVSALGLTTLSFGDNLYKWNENDNGYDVYTYFGSGSWDPSEPNLQIGEAVTLVTGASTQWTKDLITCSGLLSCTAPSLTAFGIVDDLEGDWIFLATGTGITGSHWKVYQSVDLSTWSFLESTPFQDTVVTWTTGQPAAYFWQVSNGHCCSPPFGYVRIPIASGQSKFIANQFITPNNTLAGLFSPNDAGGTVLPNGTQIQKYNGSSWDAYTWNASTKTWSPNGNATLNPGEGVYITAPAGSGVTVTFAGTIETGHLVNSVPAGTSVRSSIVPQTGTVSALGLTGLAFGDTIDKWNGTGYDIYTYFGSGSWNPSEPTLNLGEALLPDLGASVSWARDYNPVCH